jgi:predicted SAM-dependent methyltransferase
MRELNKYLQQPSPHIANLGCGHSNQPESYGIDIQDLPGVDLVADLNGPIQLPSNTFDYVKAMDFLEHIDQKNCIKMMEEVYRILKPGGQLIFNVPSTDGNNMGAFQDPTHVSFWNQNKFWYFLDEKYGKGFRTLYNIRCWFIPRELQTYYNEWNITYVRGVLEKPV